jgi:hypothetical protein
MTDQELRDRLAKEYGLVLTRHRQEHPGYWLPSYECFKDGWDAARANEYKPILKEHGGTYSVSCNLSGWAEKERDRLQEQLKIAVEALEHYCEPSNLISIYGLPKTDRAREALEKMKGEK